MSVVKLYDVRWISHTAGPSPVTTKFGSNARVELFFMGCKKAAAGNPCNGCFNPNLWKTIKGSRELDPTKMAAHIEKFAPQKYVTIVGGEPFDQPEGLTILCEELRKRDFHIIVFTHYSLKDTFGKWREYERCHLHIARTANPPDIIEGWKHDLFIRFLQSIDILIDGEYDQNNRIYDESLQDGFHNAIGSSNQVIWDLRTWRENNFTMSIYGQLADNVIQLGLRETDNSLVFLTRYNSFKVFPLCLKESKYIKEKHTRWYVSSFNRETPEQVIDDFYHYYYLLRYKSTEKSERESKNDIKRDIKAYGISHNITEDIVDALCNYIDDPNFFLYNKPWVNTIARYFDKKNYEVEFNRMREVYS